MKRKKVFLNILAYNIIMKYDTRCLNIFKDYSKICPNLRKNCLYCGCIFQEANYRIKLYVGLYVGGSRKLYHSVDLIVCWKAQPNYK